MRVVSWNMGGAYRGSGYRKFQEDAWRYLLDELQPDLALVQEVPLRVPPFVPEAGALVQVPATEGADWGTALLVRGGAARQLSFESKGSYLCAAEVTIGASSLVAVSAHICADNAQQESLRTVVGALALTFRDRSCIVAGDFNAARHWDTVYRRNTYGWFFDAMASSFHDCHWSAHGREVQTFWGKKAGEPYQDDHIFVSPNLAPHVISCNVVDNARVRALSDHGPIQCELAL